MVLWRASAAMGIPSLRDRVIDIALSRLYPRSLSLESYTPEECLDWLLFSYLPEESNLTKNDLSDHMTELVPATTTRIPDGVAVSTSPIGYFFFPRTPTSIEVPIGRHDALCVPLEPSNYGFTSEHKTTLRPCKLELYLTDEAASAYERLLATREIELSELCETVGFVVNHSMEFDFEKAKAIHAKGLSDMSVAAYEEALYALGYKPHGGETLKGICSSAGKLIRQILFSLRLDKRIGFFNVGSYNGVSHHDSTLVFDKPTGHWAVINSKSPTKPYNLVPQERLVDFGRPYVV